MSGKRYKKQSAPFRQQESPVTAITRVEASYTTGPLPPPGMLIKYNEAVPGGAERILAMAERQSSHREEMETTVLTANVRSQTRGSWFGFIVAMTAIVGGIYLIKIGQSAQGLAAIISSLAALTAVFVYGKKKSEKEQKGKSQALAKRMNQS